MLISRIANAFYQTQRHLMLNWYRWVELGCYPFSQLSLKCQEHANSVSHSCDIKRVFTRSMVKRELSLHLIMQIVARNDYCELGHVDSFPCFVMFKNMWVVSADNNMTNKLFLFLPCEMTEGQFCKLFLRKPEIKFNDRKILSNDL